MNITSTDPTAPPPQPLRSSSSCDRHPDEQFTGFCPSCLVERLNTLDVSAINPSSSRRPSSASAAAAAAIKTLFSATSRATNFPAPPPKPLKPASFLPELRRSKSFSAPINEALGQSLEPHRKSCDVRGKNTLSSLFSLDDGCKTTVTNTNWPLPDPSCSHQIPQISSTKPVEPGIQNKPVPRELEIEIEEDFKDPPEYLDDFVAPPDDDGDRDEIRPADEFQLQNPRNPIGINANISEIVEEKVQSLTNPKPMRDFMDVVAHTQTKKTSGGGFWAAASVFSNKWRKWRHKQKVKKQIAGKNLGQLPIKKPITRHYRETQSEIADYGLGRRSIDIDPRFSLDVPRISFDDPRYSFDEPRASWDGFLARRTFPKLPPMVSVLEDGPSNRALRADMRIPLDPPSFINDNDNIPGGSAQTRDYYLDSSSRRRRSLDRSSSIRQTAAAVVAEIDELKMASSNAKVLPTNADYPNSSRGDMSETFELSSGFREGILGYAEKKESKKSKKWGWKIWGFFHRRTHKDEDHDDKYSKYSSVNGVERSWSQSWQELNREGNNELSRNVLRSNSSLSWRQEGQFGPPFANGRRSNVDAYGNNGRRRSDFAVDINRNNARYSQTHLDNGLLRFYVTPMRANWRGGTARTGKVKPANPDSIGRSVMRLY